MFNPNLNPVDIATRRPPAGISIADTARAAHAAGICVLPPRQDGSKAPITAWTVYQTKRPTSADINRWYGRSTGLGFICGAVSGNLELFEFDERDVYADFLSAATATGLGDLVECIEAGYLEDTPSGGVHWFYRCSEIAGNTPLARRPKRPEERKNPDDKIKVKIETRGEGGYAIVAPSGGKVHPSGRPYRLVRGGVESIATITPEGRASLFELARQFDEIPVRPISEPKASTTSGEPKASTHTGDAGGRPGDDFAAQMSWRQILEPAGWTHVRDQGEESFWLRPGGEHEHSATTNYKGGDRLCVFSTSTEFDTEPTTYGKFGAWAVLNHGGDFNAAAKALVSLGFGQRSNANADNMRSTTPISTSEDDTRPEIDAGEGDLPAITNRTWSALRAANDPPRFFRHAGYLSRIESDDEGMPIARELTRDRLRHAVAEIARFTVTKKGNVKDVHPPVAVVLNLLATPDIDLPILSGIVTAPIFGTDGKLQLERGYHVASRTYYAPTPGFTLPPVPDRPTNADIERAKHLILTELFGDFPFKSDADRAHAIALNLLPYVRLMIDGPTPFHMVEAPTRGTGKGKLVTAALLPGIGHSVPVVTQSAEDEMRKRITTQLAEGRRAILLDNISRLDSDVMAAVLTATVWEDRRLGSNEMIRVPIRTIWTGTANNAILSEDITRRAIRIRLDAGVEHPWTRNTDGFRHPDLMEWAAHNRAELVWAGLTLVQAWIAAGQPQFKKHSLGSFERWAAVMGGILDVAGILGFLDNLDEFYESADVEGVIWREFVAAWWDTHREKIVTAGELFPLAEAIDGFPIHGEGARALRTAFGKALGRMRDRVIGEFRIAPAGVAHKQARWRLLPIQRDKMLSFDGGDVLLEKGDMGDIGGRLDGTPREKKDDGHLNISIWADAKTSPNVPHVPPFLARNGTTTPNVTTTSEKAAGANGVADEREVFEL